jgi:hypothetical protein
MITEVCRIVPEVVLEFPLVTDAEAPTTIVETLVDIVTEPGRSSRLCTKPMRFEYEALSLRQ